MYYDLPAFVVGPGWPTSASVIQSQMNASMPDVPRRLLIPRWLYPRSWDFREYLLHESQIQYLIFSPYLHSVRVHICEPGMLHSPGLAVHWHV